MTGVSVFTISYQKFAVIFLFMLAAIALTATGAVLSGSAAERIITVFFISLIAVVGMGIYSGNSGILSFGHLAFMGIGAYASALLTVPTRLKIATLPHLPSWLQQTQLSLEIALLIGIVLTMIVALVIGLALSQLSGASATIATLGVLIIVHGILIGWRDFTRGSQSFFGVPRETTVWIAAAGCLMALVVASLYRESASGLRLRACRENAVASRSVGVNIYRESLIAWVISAGIMALAGGLLAHFLGAFSPKKFYFVDTFFLLSMLIVGGMNTVTGAVIGSVLITFISELLRRLESGFELFGIEIPAVFGTTQIGISLLILFVMFRKSDGVAGYQEWYELLFKKFSLDQLNAPSSAVEVKKHQQAHKLQVEKISKHFGGVKAVNDISMTLKSGQMTGLIGPNGSGKTTLLNLLSGVLPPTSGQMHVGQSSLAKLPLHQFFRYGIARTFQNIHLFNHLTVMQNVMVSVLNQNKSTHAKVLQQECLTLLKRLGLLEKADVFAGTLSYGDQRRVEIARALALKPSLLLLDEPAAGMNHLETQELTQTLQELCQQEQIGLLLVDHDLKLIHSLCHEVYVMNEGHLIAHGTPDEVIRSQQVIHAYLGQS